jgi:hypothetical protein
MQMFGANLMVHIQREHMDTLETVKKKGSGPFLQLFAKKETNLCRSVEWIMKDLLPFSFCKKPTTGKFSRLDSISVDRLMKAMKQFTGIVKQKVKRCLPDSFSLAFDD